MIVRYPEYFSRFSCLASECPDTCCRGWEIQIDRKTLERYKSETGFLKEKLGRWVDFQTGSLKFQNGICPFLEQGLCSLQKERGEQMLCRTCRRYPRHTEEYGKRREYSLSFSCPAAAKLLVCQDTPIWFIEKAVPGKARPEEEVETELLEMLAQIRQTAIRISQNRSVSLEWRMAVVLAMCRDIQRRMGKFENRPRLSEIPGILEKYEFGLDSQNPVLLEKLEKCRFNWKEQQKKISRWMDILFELRPVERHWERLLLQLLENMRQERKRKDSQKPERYEHILVSYLDLYLLGAVYDDDLFTKAEMAVFHCFMLQRMETYLEESLPKLLYLYGREIEHSKENLEYLEKRLASEGQKGFWDMIGCILPAADDNKGENCLI